MEQKLDKAYQERCGACSYRNYEQVLALVRECDRGDGACRCTYQRVRRVQYRGESHRGEYRVRNVVEERLDVPVRDLLAEERERQCADKICRQSAHGKKGKVDPVIHRLPPLQSPLHLPRGQV